MYYCVAIIFVCRIVEPCSGALYIDDVNVLDISLHKLRNNVAIVPQVTKTSTFCTLCSL